MTVYMGDMMIEETIYPCPCCNGEQMLFAAKDSLEEVTYFKCTKCDAILEVRDASEDRRQDLEFFKNGGTKLSNEKGITKCIRCGHELFISGNADSCEDADDSQMIATVMSECPYCGFQETIWQQIE